MIFDKTDPAYLEIIDYVECIFKPAISRIIEQIMYLYSLTIENDSCILRYVNRGKKEFAIVSDSFLEYH